MAAPKLTAAEALERVRALRPHYRPPARRQERLGLVDPERLAPELVARRRAQLDRPLSYAARVRKAPAAARPRVHFRRPARVRLSSRRTCQGRSRSGNDPPPDPAKHTTTGSRRP